MHELLARVVEAHAARANRCQRASTRCFDSAGLARCSDRFMTCGTLGILRTI